MSGAVTEVQPWPRSPWRLGTTKCPECYGRGCSECGGTGERVGLVSCNDYSISWIGDPACESKGEDEARLIADRLDIEVLGMGSDPDPCYSYDDYAVVRLGDDLYVLHTSGCSCPSPSETWYVAYGPQKTLAALEEEIEEWRREQKYVPGSVAWLKEALEDAAMTLALPPVADNAGDASGGEK